MGTNLDSEFVSLALQLSCVPSPDQFPSHQLEHPILLFFGCSASPCFEITNGHKTPNWGLCPSRTTNSVWLHKWFQGYADPQGSLWLPLILLYPHAKVALECPWFLLCHMPPNCSLFAINSGPKSC